MSEHWTYRAGSWCDGLCWGVLNRHPYLTQKYYFWGKVVLGYIAMCPGGGIASRVVFLMLWPDIVV